jgi:hypothetical protein
MDVLIFTSLYLQSCMWPDGISRWIWKRNRDVHQILWKSWKKCDGDPSNDLTSIRGRKHEPYTESPKSTRTRKPRQVKVTVKGMLIIFFDIKGIVHKEFALAGQTVSSAYYCDVQGRQRENVRRLRPELGWQRTGCCIKTTSHTSIFTIAFLTKTNITVVPTHHTFLFPRLEIKQKGCHFETTEVIEAESQAVLNTLREDDFQEKQKTPWSESASELYRPSDRRLSAKWLPTFVDKGCHVVSATDPYGRILGFLDRSRYFSIK